MNELKDTGLTPMAYLKIFFRRKEILIIASLIGLFGGICVGLILPRKYEASTVLLVEESKSQNPLFNQLAVATTVKQRLATIKESILGWNSLVELVKRMGLEGQAKTEADLEKIILGIRDHATIKISGDSIIKLYYEGEDPIKTQAIVKNISEIFIERNLNIQNKETADAIKFIEEQLRVYQGKIKSAEIAQLKDDLKTLLVDSTEEHPRVKEIRNEIAVKEEELKRDNLEYTEDVNLSANVTNPLINDIKKALDNVDGGTPVVQEGTQENYYKVLLLDKLDDVMARDVGVNTNIYNMLLQRLETAKITQRLQSSKEGTRYTVLDPPRVPLKPTKPNKFLLAIVGLFGGMIVGVALVFGLEFLDKSFIDVEEAKNFLGVPLMGAVSKIYTQGNLWRERQRLRWLYSVTCLGGFLVILLTIVVKSFLVH